MKNGQKLDNRWVVPHNLYLCTKYNAHINVEICNTIGAVKYLFKYVYKGSDKVTFSLDNPTEPTPNIPSEIDQNITANKNLDEIKKYLDARYVSASEACWRIFQYDTNKQNPHTIRLPVHLEGQQNILFDDDGNLNEILEKNHETPLTQYLKMNETDPEARELYYYQMPISYIWNKAQKKWTKRKK